MRRELAGALAAGVMLVGGAVFTAQSAMADPADNCKTFVTENISKPDSGNHGDWATVTFTRNVELCKTDTDAADGVTSYTATFKDEGTFTTTEGAKSPGTGAAVDLLKGISGTFTGGATFLFTTATDLNLAGLEPFKTDGDWPSTSVWIGTWLADKGFVTGSYKDGNTWGWTYATGCETWVNSGPKDEGSITTRCATPRPVTQAENVSDATCEAAGNLTLPEVEGVKYTRDPVTGTGAVTVTATAEEGYKLADGTWTWEVMVPEKLPADSDECKEPTTPPTAPACEAYDYTGNPHPGNLCSVTLPEDPNCDDIGYRVTVLNPDVDPWRLDQGGQVGIGCEDKPLKFDGGSGGGDPTETPSPAPSTSNVADGGNLPVTGMSSVTMYGIVGIGLLLAAGGGLLLFVGRRRRDRGAVESA